MTIELYQNIQKILETEYVDEGLRRQQTGRIYSAVFQAIRDDAVGRHDYFPGSIASPFGRQLLADREGLAVHFHIGYDTALDQLPPSGNKVKKLITPGGVELLKKPKSRNAVLDRAPLGTQSRDIIENAIELLGNRD